MTEINKNIVCAAVLQELAHPFLLVYIDMSDRKLYLAVSTKPSNSKENSIPTFSAVITSPTEIERYMNEEISLENIFSTRKTIGFEIINDNITVNDNNTFHADNTFEAMKWFDPEFCEEEGWVKVFLKRYNNGEPLEIA